MPSSTSGTLCGKSRKAWKEQNEGKTEAEAEGEAEMKIVRVGNFPVDGEALEMVALIECANADEARELASLLYKEVEVKEKESEAGK